MQVYFRQNMTRLTYFDSWLLRLPLRLGTHLSRYLTTLLIIELSYKIRLIKQSRIRKGRFSLKCRIQATPPNGKYSHLMAFSTSII